MGHGFFTIAATLEPRAAKRTHACQTAINTRGDLMQGIASGVLQ